MQLNFTLLEIIISRFFPVSILLLQHLNEKHYFLTQKSNYYIDGFNLLFYNKIFTKRLLDLYIFKLSKITLHVNLVQPVY